MWGIPVPTFGLEHLGRTGQQSRAIVEQQGADGAE